MLTPDAYGQASQYITGIYPGVANLTPPARFLAGLVGSYNGANLPIRRVNYYTGATQSVTNRVTTTGTVFVGRWGLSRAAFSLNSDWSTNKSLT